MGSRSISPLRIVATAGFFVAGLAVGLNAQGPQGTPTASTPSYSRFSVSGGVGSARGSTWQDVEAAFRAGGFDDTFCAGCVAVPATVHPYSEQERQTLFLNVRWQITSVAHAALTVARSNLAKTRGYMATPDGLGAYVHVEQSVTDYGLLVGLNLPQATAGAWVAAGPALYHATLSGGYPGAPRATALRVGGMGAAGIEFPSESRLFVGVQVRYHIVGHADLEPIDVTDGTGGIVGTVPRTPVNFTHWAVLGNAGVRF